ncbi:MAG: hypothetical protein KBS96_02290 [Lachnospiraceae bacterium]|nr:hypothetical protein [Candidatus Colinaster scatohippi]
MLTKEDNKILVISKYGLDVKPFNIEYTGIGWGNCSLRKWLNEDFFDYSFDEEEKSSICVGYTVKDDSRDFMFLLSTVECNKYFGTNVDRKCHATAMWIDLSKL